MTNAQKADNAVKVVRGMINERLRLTGRRPTMLALPAHLYMGLMEHARRTLKPNGEPVLTGDSPPYCLFEGVDVFPETLGVKL